MEFTDKTENQIKMKSEFQTQSIVFSIYYLCICQSVYLSIYYLSFYLVLPPELYFFLRVAGKDNGKD
jgi:hypothetical protein